MPRKKPISRKRRTREHVIADLSANHVERHALLCGFTVQRVTHDYGIDLLLSTYTPAGEVENGDIYLQLKATDRLRRLADGKSLAFRIARADLHYWLRQPLPVILLVYDAGAEVAYWLYVQAYFAKLPGFDLKKARPEVTVRIPTANVVDQTAMRNFARFRDNVLAQTKETIHYE